MLHSQQRMIPAEHGHVASALPGILGSAAIQQVVFTAMQPARVVGAGEVGLGVRIESLRAYRGGMTQVVQFRFAPYLTESDAASAVFEGSMEIEATQGGRSVLRGYASIRFGSRADRAEEEALLRSLLDHLTERIGRPSTAITGNWVGL